MVTKIGHNARSFGPSTPVKERILLDNAGILCGAGGQCSRLINLGGQISAPSAEKGHEKYIV